MHTHFQSENLTRKYNVGGPRHRWEDSTKMDIIKIGCKGVTEFIWLRLGSCGELF
jgi:hypothetical protein